MYELIEINTKNLTIDKIVDFYGWVPKGIVVGFEIKGPNQALVQIEKFEEEQQTNSKYDFLKDLMIGDTL